MSENVEWAKNQDGVRQTDKRNERIKIRRKLKEGYKKVREINLGFAKENIESDNQQLQEYERWLKELDS